jgi:membrane-bound lytic murein transglycosylase B
LNGAAQVHGVGGDMRAWTSSAFGLALALKLALALAAVPADASVSQSPRPPQRPAALAEAAEGARSFSQWREAFALRATAAGIAPATVQMALAQATYLPEVIALDRRQAEFTRAIWDYLDSAVSDSRVAAGRREAAARAGLLARIEAAHGVAPEVVLAIWGMETAFGTNRGATPVISALATLAHEGRRGPFFEAELLAALRILQAGETTPARMIGSWAGAMGHTQFMPSSYLQSAVDFDGDGRRDVWGADPTDALASAAAYLRRFGWQSGAPWGVEVRLPAGFDHRSASRSQRRTVGDWAAAGVRLANGGALPDHGPGAVLLPAGAAGPAFLVFSNFEVLARYNNATAYVLGVGLLSDRIAGRPGIAAGWPRAERLLTASETRELQRRLTALGHDTGGIDGRIGPATTEAVRAFQAAQGLTPDGFATMRLLERLR